MPAIDDLERQFLLQVLGVSGVGLTLNDLRTQFYSGVVNGTISLGAKSNILNVSTVGDTVALSQVSGNGTTSLNRATWAPFYLTKAVKASAFAVNVSVAAAAGGTVRFGLWNALASTGLVNLNSKLFESGEIASTSTGLKSFAQALTIPAGGPYWVGVVFHTATCSITSAKNGPQIYLPSTQQGFDMMFADGVTGAFPTSGANPNGDYSPLLFATLAP